MKRWIFSLVACAGLITGVVWWYASHNFSLNALTVNIAALNSDNGGGVDIAQLLKELPLEPVSSTQGPVSEPAIPPQVPLVFHPGLGLGRSSFLIAIPNGWGVVRFLGPRPAGAGLTGEALSEAQRQQLGAPNDSIPVVVVAHTINQAMEFYFKPLLLKLPNGSSILNQTYINASYFSPEYPQTDDFDNAFVKGLQSLFVYPSSCFKDSGGSQCQTTPWLSPGHDPSVVVHEMGHVMFNMLRGGKTLEGFQWAAVNEGYADYFSSSFFNLGAVGTIWKSTKTSTSHLRNLAGVTTTSQGDVFDNVHSYGVIWASTLWRIRQRLAQTLAPNLAQGDPQALARSPLVRWDAAVMQSIVYLGETAKPRLGDGATALLKALDALGLGSWKPIALEEFGAAGIDLTTVASPQAAPGTMATLPYTPPSSSSSGCGVVAGLGGGAPLAFQWLFLLLMPGFLWGCKVTRKSLTKTTGAPSLWYRCFPGVTSTPPPDGQSPGTATAEEAFPQINLYLQEKEGDPHQYPNMSVIQISDERFSFAPSTLFAIVDVPARRIDHFRGRDGQPFEKNLIQPTVTMEVALAHIFAQYSQLLVTGGEKLLQDPNKTNAIWDFEGVKYTATGPIVALFQGKLILPTEVSTPKGVLCQSQGWVSSPQAGE